MDNFSLYKGSKINLNVSRETCNDLEKYIDLLIDQNKVINLISRKNQNKDYIRERHIIDSMQAVDFVDFNCKKILDIGSGAGFPAVVLSILAKNLNKKIEINMFEKSYHKSNFLKYVSKELNLNTKIFQKNIFEEIDSEEKIITARAFKSLPIILDLVDKNFKNFKNIILFMGETGEKILKDVLRGWMIDYDLKKSLTNNKSFILNIKNFEKK